MRTRNLQTTVLTRGLLIILTSCDKRELNQKDEIAKLLKTDKEWAEASASKDAKRFVSFYDSSAFLISGTRQIKGIKKLDSVWSKWMESPVHQLTWEAQSGEVSNNIGVTYGIYFNQYLNGTDTVKTKQTYVAVWMKQNNGDWKVLIDKP